MWFVTLYDPETHIKFCFIALRKAPGQNLEQMSTEKCGSLSRASNSCYVPDFVSQLWESFKTKSGPEILCWGQHGSPTTVHGIHECKSLCRLLQCIVLVSPPHHHDNDNNDHHDHHHHHQQDPQSGTHTRHHQRCWSWCCLRLCRTLEVWKWSVNITSCKFIRQVQV